MKTFTVELQKRITQTHQMILESESFEQAKQKALESISENTLLSQEDKISFLYLRTVITPETSPTFGKENS